MLRVIEKAAENGDLNKQLHAITGKEKCQMIYRHGIKEVRDDTDRKDT